MRKFSFTGGGKAAGAGEFRRGHEQASQSSLFLLESFRYESDFEKTGQMDFEGPGAAAAEEVFGQNYCGYRVGGKEQYERSDFYRAEYPLSRAQIKGQYEQ